jgi:hypothetical protein
MPSCDIKVLAWATDCEAVVLEWVLSSHSIANALSWGEIVEQWAADSDRDWYAFTDGSGNKPPERGMLVWRGRFRETKGGYLWTGDWEALDENDWNTLRTTGTFPPNDAAPFERTIH